MPLPEFVLERMLQLFVHSLEKWVFLNLNVLVKRVIYGQNPFDRSRLRNLRVLHRSDNFLVVNKEFDIIINDDDLTRISLYRQIQYTFPDLVNPKYKHGFPSLHRLDYATSGILVVPLNRISTNRAGKAFAKKLVQKYYLAIVRGHVAQDFIRVSLPIGDDKRKGWLGIKMCSSRKDYCLSPRDSETKMIVLSRGVYGSYPATKVLLKPITGRRHQLRIHCHELGHTIVGDFTYSDRRDILPYRMCLHAYRMVLPNELEPLDVIAPDPFLPTEHRQNLYQPVKVLRDSELQETFDMFDDPRISWFNVQE